MGPVLNSYGDMDVWNQPDLEVTCLFIYLKEDCTVHVTVQSEKKDVTFHFTYCSYCSSSSSSSHRRRRHQWPLHYFLHVFLIYLISYNFGPL
jgi:hypothetical protein